MGTEAVAEESCWCGCGIATTVTVLLIILPYFAGVALNKGKWNPGEWSSLQNNKVEVEKVSTDRGEGLNAAADALNLNSSLNPAAARSSSTSIAAQALASEPAPDAGLEDPSTAGASAGASLPGNPTSPLTAAVASLPGTTSAVAQPQPGNAVNNNSTANGESLQPSQRPPPPAARSAARPQPAQGSASDNTTKPIQQGTGQHRPPPPRSSPQPKSL